MSAGFGYTFRKAKSQIYCIIENLKIVVQFCPKTLYNFSGTISKCHLVRGRVNFFTFYGLARILRNLLWFAFLAGIP